MGERLLNSSSSRTLSLKNSSGQFAIEAVLLMTVLVSAFIYGTSQLRENKALARLISTPWQNVTGMIECGVWGPVRDSCKNHPGQRDRSVSLNARNI